MNRDRLRELLESVRRGETETDQALEHIARLPFVDTGDARVDTHRTLRNGLPEVVYGAGKTPAQIVEIVRVLREAEQDVLATRVSPEVAAEVRAGLDGVGEYDPVSRLFWVEGEEVAIRGKGTIAVVSAGTADSSVAAEAVGVARRFGNGRAC